MEGGENEKSILKKKFFYFFLLSRGRGPTNSCSITITTSPDLVSLAVSWHGDAGGGYGCQVRTDLTQTQGVLHPLLSTHHQHLLKLKRKKEVNTDTQFPISLPSPSPANIILPYTHLFKWLPPHTTYTSSNGSDTHIYPPTSHTHLCKWLPHTSIPPPPTHCTSLNGSDTHTYPPLPPTPHTSLNGSHTACGLL